MRIIYDRNKINMEQTLSEFNRLQPSIKYTIEKELHKEINFLGLTIHRKDKKLRFSIYGKPTQIDIITLIALAIHMNTNHQLYSLVVVFRL
jgi:hypothetical protein